MAATYSTRDPYKDGFLISIVVPVYNESATIAEVIDTLVKVPYQKQIIIVDDGKLVDSLGTRSPLPVEVVPFGWKSHIPFLEDWGCQPILREGPGGDPYRTDNGNYILDCRFHSGISDPAVLDVALSQRAGVVETGLFLGMAGEVLVGTDGGVRQIVRPSGP